MIDDILLRHIPNWFDRTQNEDTRIPWEEGVSARSVASGLVGDGANMVILRNGERLEDTELGCELSPGDSLVCMDVPEADTFVLAIFGVELLSLSGAAAYAAWGAYISAVLYGIYAMIGALTPTTHEGDQESATYGYANLQRNPIAEGSAIQVVYGEHRVAPQIINHFIHASPGPPETFVYILGAISHGTVESIGGKTSDSGPFAAAEATPDFPLGIQINGQPLENFPGSEVYVRMGAFSQSAIPGFALAKLSFDVGTTLSQEDETGTTPMGNKGVTATAAGTYSSGALPTWDSVVAYSMTSDADEFTALIEFPFGLYYIHQDGSITTLVVELQTRYVELDSGGSPAGDYVVLPPEIPIILDEKGSLAYEFSHQFLDPDTFSAPGTSSYLSVVGAADDYAHTASMDGPVQVPHASEMTFECWVKCDPASEDISDIPDGMVVWPFDFPAPIAKHFDGAAGTHGEGWRFKLIDCDDDPQGPPPCKTIKLINSTLAYEKIYSPSIGLKVELANGSALVGGRFKVVGLEKSLFGGRTHLAFTYRADAPGMQGDGRLSVFVNGHQVGASDGNYLKVPSGDEPIWATGKQFIVAKDGSDGLNGNKSAAKPTFSALGIDEAVWWQKEKSPSDILSSYNAGKGVAHNGSEPGAFYGWHFNEQTAGVTPSFHPATSTARDMTLAGTSSSTPANMILESDLAKYAASGAPKRGKYKVEIQRLNVEQHLLGHHNNQKFDECKWGTITLTDYEQFTYPGVALIAVKIKASDQLPSTNPTITCITKGAKCPVWTQASVSSPQFTLEWTQNPAWVLADALTNSLYGLGQFYEFSDLDVQAFQSWADWCDEYLYDARGEAAASTMSYSSPHATITMPKTGEGSGVPAHWKVKSSATGTVVDGTRIFIEDASDASWDTSEANKAAGGMEIVSMSEAGSNYLVTVTWVGSAPTGTPTGTVKALEKRMQYDGVFDEPRKSAWDACLEIAKSGWAVPVRMGSKISVVYDHARSIVGRAFMGNIIEGSLNILYSGIEDRPNSLDVEFLDRDQNYERNFAAFDHTTVIDPSKFSSYRRKRFSLRGVTRRSQATRHAVRDLNSFFLIRRAVDFALSVDALAWQPGDRIEVSHDVPQWGFSGRCYADATAKNKIALDRSVTIEGGKTYEVRVQNSADGTAETGVVSTSAGTYAAGVELTFTGNLTFLPLKDDLYAFGEQNIATKDFQVISVQLDPQKLGYRVKAIEYNEDIYAVDFGELPDISPSALPVPTAGEGLPLPPSSIDASEEAFRGRDGGYRPAISVSWQHPASTRGLVAGSILYMAPESPDAVPRVVGEAKGTETQYKIAGQPLAEGIDYFIRVVAYNKAGAHTHWSAVAPVPVSIDGIGVVPDGAPTVLAVMRGDQAEYSISGDEPDASKVTEIRRGYGGWILAPLIGNIPTGSSDLAPTGDWATAVANASGAGAPNILARVKYGTGMYGKRGAERFDAAVDGASVHLVDKAMEDEGTPFDGTISGLSRTTYDGDDVLQFSGSDLSGSYVSTEFDIRTPQVVYAQLVVDAEQVDAISWDSPSATGFEWGMPVGGVRMTWEGPLTLIGGEEFTTMRIQAAISETSSAGTDYVEWNPGIIYGRTFKFALAVTRPSTDYDIRIRRVGVRITKVPARMTDMILTEALS